MYDKWWNSAPLMLVSLARRFKPYHFKMVLAVSDIEIDQRCIFYVLGQANYQGNSLT